MDMMFAMPDSLSSEQQIVAALRRIMRAVELHSRQLVEAIGLTGPQLATLQDASRLQPTSPSVIARAVHLSQATVTGILQRLESRGLIERTRSETDRRSVQITVTTAGEDLLKNAPSLLQDHFREKLENLDEWERLLILSTLDRVATLMGAEDMDASPHLVSNQINPPTASK